MLTTRLLHDCLGLGAPGQSSSHLCREPEVKARCQIKQCQSSGQLIENLDFDMRILLIIAGVETNPGPSNPSLLNVCHININSITAPGRVDELSQFTDSNDIDILLLTETKLDDQVSPSLYKLDRFHAPLTKHRNRHGGGVAVYVSTALPVRRLHLTETDDFEWIWCLIKMKHFSLVICNTYVPPNISQSQQSLFIENLNENVAQASILNQTCMLITGDFNCGNIFLNPCYGNRSSSLMDVRLKDSIESMGFTQLIDQPTRVTSNTANLLDLVITSNSTIVIDSGVLPPFSNIDHYPVYASLDISKPPQVKQSRDLWDFTRLNINKLVDSIQSVDWSSIISHDIEIATSEFTEAIMNAAREAIPIRTVTVKQNDKPWVTSELKKHIRKRDRLFKIAKRAQDSFHWNKWKEQRNYVTDLNRSLKDNYLQQQIHHLSESKQNPQRYHMILNRILGRNKTETIPPLDGPNGTTIIDDVEKATLLNEHFAEQSQSPRNKQVPIDFANDNIQKLSELRVSETDVLKLLNSLNPSKSSGPDKLPTKLLKLIAILIYEPLTKLFNKSLSEGRFPTLWKTANITAIFKRKGSCADPTNYRPISLLPCLSKILEKLVFRAIYSHLTDNNILTEKQSGYRPKHGTQLQLTYLVHNLYAALDHSHDFTAVYLDISKYFDTIWHAGLLYKCEAQCGLSGSLLCWLKSYLSDRLQRVRVGNSYSPFIKINAGCPQGSVLGPLLALIYLNDLTHLVHNDILLFADDTSLYSAHPHGSVDAQLSLQKDLDIIHNFGTKWEISFNVKKTKQQTFTNRAISAPLCLKMGGEVIPQVTCHKHLGLIISTDLRFHEHVLDTVRKVNIALSPLYPIAAKIPRHILLNIFYTYIRPLFDYADIIYDGHLTIADSQRLEKLQYRIGRLITGALYRTSSENIRIELGWSTLKTRRTLHRLFFFYKLMHEPHNFPTYITDIITETREVATGRQLRNSTSRTIPQNRTLAFQRSFFPSTIREWNLLPQSMRSVTFSIASFKKAVYQQFSTKQPPFYFQLGSKQGNVLHTRLRLGLSTLNADLFRVNSSKTDTPSCKCGHPREDVKHFVLQCPLYADHRFALFSNLNALSISTSHSLLTCLISGNGLTDEAGPEVANIFQQFILNTRRFHI